MSRELPAALPQEKEIFPYKNWIIAVWFSDRSGRNKKKNGEVLPVFN
jgi:hypothetical protein